MRTILRTSRYYKPGKIIDIFKARVLGYMEYRTAAIYHCAKHLLDQVDLVQKRLCKAVGITSEDVLIHFNLAPLKARRDMAMLGLIHRAVLGKGPDHFNKHFVRAPAARRPEGREAIRSHNYQLVSFR